jgi:hypothetical protein
MGCGSDSVEVLPSRSNENLQVAQRILDPGEGLEIHYHITCDNCEMVSHLQGPWSETATLYSWLRRLGGAPNSGRIVRSRACRTSDVLECALLVISQRSLLSNYCNPLLPVAPWSRTLPLTSHAFLHRESSRTPSSAGASSAKRATTTTSVRAASPPLDCRLPPNYAHIYIFLVAIPSIFICDFMKLHSQLLPQKRASCFVSRAMEKKR